MSLSLLKAHPKNKRAVNLNNKTTQLEKLLSERIIVLDGALGTSVQALKL